jgi:hypothetical protein
MGKGGGGSPGPTQNTSYQTNIPEYAKPYVETMLGATQKQLFQGTPTEGGGFDITGFQPYKAYGGTYDEQGNQTSYDPTKGIAPFQPMQVRAQQGVANMQAPSQYGQAMGITGAGIRGALGTAGQGVDLAGMGYETAGAGNRYAQQATNPNAMQSYMSPYMQNVVDVQQREAQRAADVARTGRNAQAVQAGAFGGSRQAIMDAEAERNLSLQKGDIQATGLQSAFKEAQQAQQYGANLDLQGRQAGMAGVGAGIGAQQAGYGQMMSGAQNLAGLGQQQLQAQQGIYGLQNQYGAQQQAQQQQTLNQAMQDYANAQQYPLMQLGTMSNMLRGLPMQAQTTQQYVAQPNMLTQAIGAAGTGASLYNAFNPTQTKTAAKGGIMSYGVGGEVESDLENMDEQGLQKQLKESSSPSVKRMAQRILRERQMSKAPGMAGGGIIAFNTGNAVKDEEYRFDPFGAMTQEQKDARRNIDGLTLAEERDKQQGKLSSSEVLQQRVMQGKPTGSVMAQPQGIVQAAPPPPAPTLNQAVEGAVDLTPAMKALQAEVSKEAAVPYADRLAEVQAAKKAAGLEAPGVEQKARLMAERANAADEAERTKNLRMAEFFASWGSTPGSTLSAGMAAFKQTVPNLISDEKEAKRIRMEIDKSIAGLDEATRLEKKGDFEAATALKTKYADRMQAVNLEIIKIQEDEAKGKRADVRKEQGDIRQGQREEAKDTRYATLQKEITQMKIDSDERLKKIDAGFRAADKVEGNTNRLITLYTNAQSDKAAVESRITNIMNSQKYQDALTNSRMQIDSDSGPAVIKMRDDAKEILRVLDESFKTNRETADNTAKFLEERLSAKGIELPTKKPKAGDRPGLDDPTLQKP